MCGVLSFTLEVELDESPDYVQVMFSVPYNLNTYGAYYAVGISQEYTNNSTEIFEDLYYYTGPFRRAEAGKMITFSSQRGLNTSSKK